MQRKTSQAWKEGGCAFYFQLWKEEWKLDDSVVFPVPNDYLNTLREAEVLLNNNNKKKKVRGKEEQEIGN